MKKNFLVKAMSVILIIVLAIPSPLVYAASVGLADTVLNTEYVAIVNTSTTETQSTGSIVFNDKDIAPNSKQNTKKIQSENKVENEDIEINLPKNNSVPKKQQAITTTYKIGDKKHLYQENYTLIGIGKHSYIWMEDKMKKGYDARNLTDDAAKEMAEVYDGRPYDMLNLLSNNNIPYGDNSGKLSILLEDTGGSSGFYAYEDGITAIHIESPYADKYAAGAYESANGLLVHEGQHALFHRLTCHGDRTLAGQFTWINEGLSVAAMEYTWGGASNSGWLQTINGSKPIREGSSLFYDYTKGTTAQNYGMPYLFIRYLINQKEGYYNPIPFLQSIYDVSATGKTPTEWLNALISHNKIKDIKNINEALEYFYPAIFAQESTGKYGFYKDITVYMSVDDYPVYYGISGKNVDLKPTSAIIVKTLNNSFTVPSDAGKDVKFIGVDPRTEILKPKDGDGSFNNPYIIKTVNDLMSMSAYQKSHFKLNNDIDLTNYIWPPLTNFRGVLDGNGHTIKGLSNSFMGALGYDGVVRNLNVIANINSEFNEALGVIARYNNGTISDVNVSGNVNVKLIGSSMFKPPYFGAIAGINKYSANIKNTSSDLNITVNLPFNTSYIGGLVGSQQGTVENCYTRGSITVHQPFTGNYKLNVGGLFGQLYTRTWGVFTNNLYSTTNITIDAKGISEQNKNIGRLLGVETNINNNTPEVKNVYGLNDNKLPIAGSSTSYSENSLKTDAEMKSQHTYQNFDFNSTWKMPVNDYPKLKTGNDIKNISGKLRMDTYYIGEKLQTYDAELTVDGGKVPITEDMLNMTQWDTSTVGEKTIEGSFKNKIFKLKYTVIKPKYVKGLRVQNGNSGKTSYVVGDTYNMKGVVLEADVGKGYMMPLYSGFTHDKTAPLTTNDKEVTFTYDGHTVKLPIKVETKAISKIEVVKAPNITMYNAGTNLNLSGALFRVVYNNGVSSKIFDSSELNNYGIKIAKQVNGIYKDFQLSTKLTNDDNNVTFYAYTNGLPNDKNSVFSKIATISVKSSMVMRTQNLYFSVGIDNYYVESDSLTGGSGKYETTLISGTKPSWLKQLEVPKEQFNDSFLFEGKPTKEEQTTLVYRIRDVKTGETLNVKVIINAVPLGKEADVLNYVISEPVHREKFYGSITNDTILVKVPNSVNLKTVTAQATLSRGATSSPIMNEMYADFSRPKTYTITSEDKKVNKKYTVKLEHDNNLATKIEIQPNISSLYKGAKQIFTANVKGVGTFTQDVTWSVSLNKSAKTQITSNGELNVDINEPAEEIMVTASSVDNPATTESFYISLLDLPKLTTPTNLFWSNGVANWNKVENAINYEVSLYKDNALITQSKTIVNGTSFNFKDLIVDTGKYKFSVIALGDTTVYAPSDSVFSGDYDFVVAPVVTGIEITPKTVNLVIGQSQQFSAKVLGSNITSQDVVFEVIGGNSGTTIDTNGLLKVSDNETAKSLKVRATSKINNLIYGESIVNVSLKTLQSPTNVKLNNTLGSWDIVSNASGYTLELKKDGVLIKTDIKINDVNTNSYDFNNLMTTNGKYSFTITANGNNSVYGDSIKAESTEVDYVVPPTVTSIQITPSNAVVKKGKTQVFKALVIGTNNPPQTVEWSVKGNNSTSTNINNNGTLKVASDETAKTLMVEAVSTHNKNIKASVVVTLQLPQVDTPRGLTFNGTIAKWNAVSNANGYILKLYKDGYLITNSLVETSSTNYDFKDIMTLSGKYKFTVMAKGNGITTKDSEVANSSENNFVVPPTVSSIDINPIDVTVQKGSKKQFTALVNGINKPPQTVTWSINNNTSNSTKISKTGMLFVGDDEMSKTVTIIATSTYDNNVKGSVLVNISLPVLNAPTNLIFNGTIASFDKVNNAGSYILELYKNGSLVKNSRIEISGNSYDFNNLMTTTGDYTFKVMAKGDFLNFGSSVMVESAKNMFTAKPIVQNIEINPSSASILQGKTRQFSAKVNGLNNPSQKVEWTVLENTSKNTNITNTGLLTVGNDETAKTLTVKAVSILNNNISASAYVNVVLSQIANPTNLSWNNMLAQWNSIENCSGYYVMLYKNNELITKQKVTNNYFDFSKHITESGNYTFKVTALGNNGGSADSESVESGFKQVIINTQQQNNNNVNNNEQNKIDENINNKNVNENEENATIDGETEVLKDDKDIVAEENINENKDDNKDSLLASNNNNNDNTGNYNNSDEKTNNKDNNKNKVLTYTGIAVATTAAATTAVVATGAGTPLLEVFRKIILLLKKI